MKKPLIQSLTLNTDNKTPEELFLQLIEAFTLSETLLRITAFGLDPQAEVKCLEILKTSGIHCPVSWLLDDSKTCGLQVQYVSGIKTKHIIIENKVIGFTFEDDSAQWCFISALSSNQQLSRKDQTQDIYQQMIQGLNQASMGFDNIVRTWFYLEDILDWYDDFNEVRSAVFKDHKIFSKCVPASTGIGAVNTRGSAAMVDIIALIPKNNCTYEAVVSPLQCSALDYGSSFSRALEVDTVNSRNLMISGTASIEPEGATIHLGDCAAQVAETLKIVQAILKSRKMHWSNTSRALAYFRKTEDRHLFEKIRKEMNIPALPLVTTLLTVCRDDLLFELELDSQESML